MNRELRHAMIEGLEALVADPEEVWVLTFADPVIKHQAMLVLESAGHVKQPDSDVGIAHITLSGFDYLDELKHPTLAWLKRNWFAGTVAAATLLLALVSSVSQTLVAFKA